MTSQTAAKEFNTWLWGADVSERRILHTMVRVKDFDASIRFYTEGLGMKVLDRFDVELRRVSAVYIGFNDYRTGGVLELVQSWDHEGAYTHGSGYGHIAIGGADVPAMVARLEAMGAEVTLAPKVLMEDGPLVAFVKDPDGYSIELIQTVRAKPVKNEPGKAEADRAGEASNDEFDTWLWGSDIKETRLLHTMIRVDDVDATVKFYEQGFGMKVLDRFDVESRRASAIYLGFNDYRTGGVLELVQYWDEKGPYTHGSGYGHFAVGTADARPLVAKLEAMGAEVTLQPKVLIDGGPEVAFVKDPDGYSIEIIQTQRP